MHLYIHVPFCRRRCSYCDFAIAVRRRVPAERFVAAVLRERELRAPPEGWRAAVFDTVYLGGGTPSLLPPEHLERVLDAFPRVAGAEVTLEANPDDVSEGAARAWRAVGVTRVSLGVQSFDPLVLAWMHRTHDVTAARRAVTALRTAGIPSVSLDLIFGLPEELPHDPTSDLRQALILEPDHLSVYGLTLERGTPYQRWVRGGRSTPASEERFAREFLAIHATLTAAGFDHYEISNFARPGRGGAAGARHNSAYWSGAEYVGVGPSAHGFQGGDRRWNLRHWTAYERAVRAGLDPVEGCERLTAADRGLEMVYLGLRTARGIDERTAGNLNQGRLLAAVGAGWLTAHGGGYRATASGWVVLDELVASLTTSQEGG